ncbi:hypothetical protein EDD16DRAFT_1558878 [Pisolithus croceorrhizus]|nr:hypothetical protein EDD16DRAFT_1558878 [Pisolithus croceorrhizus]
MVVSLEPGHPISGHEGWTSPWPSGTSPSHLAYVIKSLPKPEIVSFANPGCFGADPGTMPFGVLHALRCSTNSLRILDCSGSDSFPQLHQLEELLRDLPNLRVLRCPQLVRAGRIIPNSILSSLTTLGVGKLTQVSLLEIISHDRDLPEELIIHYGKYLRTVKWASIYYTNFAPISTASSSSVHCLVSFYVTPLNGWSLPQVSYLGVESKVPTHRVFQLLCPCVVKRLLSRPSEFSIWVIVKSLHENLFRVEDDRGNLLSGGEPVSSLAGHPPQAADHHRTATCGSDMQLHHYMPANVFVPDPMITRVSQPVRF